MGKTAKKMTASLSEVHAKVVNNRMFANVISELDVNTDQLKRRTNLIQRIEKLLSEKYNASNRIISYVVRFGHPKELITSADIVPLETILSSLDKPEQLNIILHGPGGDGSVIEKMVEMCRDHLPPHSQKLRVIVPNIAKSAATLFALGADTIIMGYCSELGPIDPQIPVVNSGIAQNISAFAYIDSRDTIMKNIQEAAKKNEPVIGYMQQLSSLNMPFIQEMENLIHFAENTATQLLSKYMLGPKIADEAARERKAREISRKLLSKELFPIHGHFINAATAQKDLELDIDIIDKTDELWRLIWEYYTRAEVQMNISPSPDTIKIKLFESSEESIIAPEAAK